MNFLIAEACLFSLKNDLGGGDKNRHVLTANEKLTFICINFRNSATNEWKVKKGGAVSKVNTQMTDDGQLEQQNCRACLRSVFQRKQTHFSLVSMTMYLFEKHSQ